MKKQLYIISRNNVPTTFWTMHINQKNVAISQWNDTNKTIENINNQLPEIVVIDDYFQSKESLEWMQKIVQKILSGKHIPQIYCVSPVFIKETSLRGITILNAECYSFSAEFIKNLNYSLEANKKKLNLRA